MSKLYFKKVKKCQMHYPSFKSFLIYKLKFTRVFTFFVKRVVIFAPIKFNFSFPLCHSAEKPTLSGQCVSLWPAHQMSLLSRSTGQVWAGGFFPPTQRIPRRFSQTNFTSFCTVHEHFQWTQKRIDSVLSSSDKMF